MASEMEKLTFNCKYCEYKIEGITHADYSLYVKNHSFCEKQAELDARK